MSYFAKPLHVVYIEFKDVVNAAEFEQWLVEVERLIQLQQNFYLIMHTRLNTTFPENYRQTQAFWYKKYKASFFQYCEGLIRIAQDLEDLKRLNTPALHDAWQVPYYVSLDKTDAMNWIQKRWL